jgi:hypothetical protein
MAVVRTARLDPEARRQVKVAPARRDLPVSEYRQLAEDGEWPPEGTEGMPAAEAREEQDNREVRS